MTSYIVRTMIARALALTTLLAGAAHAAEPAWRYEVTADARAGELTVLATFAAGYADELSVDDGAEPFVRDVAVEDNGQWRTVTARRGVADCVMIAPLAS